MNYYPSVRAETEAMFHTCADCAKYLELSKQRSDCENELRQNNEKIQNLDNQVVRDKKRYIYFPIVLVTEMLCSIVVAVLALYLGLWNVLNHQCGLSVIFVLSVVSAIVSFAMAFLFDKKHKLNKNFTDSFGTLCMMVFVVMIVFCFNTSNIGGTIAKIIGAPIGGLLFTPIILLLIMTAFYLIHNLLGWLFVILFSPIINFMVNKKNTKLNNQIIQLQNHNAELSSTAENNDRTIHELKRWLDQNTPIPENYWPYAYELCALIQLRRANSLTEAINLLEESLHRIRIEKQINNLNQSINNMNNEMQTALKQMDTNLDNAVKELKKTIEENRPIYNTTVVKRYEYY